MPLQDPQLDNRSFEQILSDLRFRIPRYTKEWTNFNDSDPGMTLLQLFAWLSEQMLYQMNQVPLKNYVKFLKLLGQELGAAQPARAQLTFVAAGGATIAEPVPLRAQISAPANDGGLPLIFETERGLGLIQPPMDVLGVFDGAGFTNVSDANSTPGTTFLPFGWSADPGNALYLGFAAPDPMPPSGSVPFFPQEMTFAAFLPPSATAGAPQQCTGATQPPVPPVSLVWEYRPKQGQDWQRLNVFEDTTAAFTREGYMRVAGPRDMQPAIEPLLNAKPHFWLRVRIAGSITYPDGTIPTVDFIRPNTVDALNLATVNGEILGVSEGHPSEVFQFQFKPVQATSVQIQTAMPDGSTQAWTLAQDFLSAGPDDQGFTLDPVAGTAQFGDGDRGLIPSPTAQAIAVSYRYGGGARGNGAAAGSIGSPLTSLAGVAKVTNERPAVGGGDEQTLDDLQLRTPALLSRRDRAVTPGDFESLVDGIGGIAGAKALPLFHPDHPGVPVPGAITVVIVPDNQDVPPKPSSDLIRAICEMLDQKRLLTTEVFVKGPQYQEIRAEARVSANPYASFDVVSQAVIAAINALLDPREGAFGRELFPTNIYAAILGVADVVGVLTLNVYVDGRRYIGLQPIPVPPDGLVYGSNHIVTVEPAN